MSEPARWPRGLRREEAAAYVGVSPSTFDTMVKAGDMPEGFKWGAIRLWDREDLDAYFVMLKEGKSAEVVPERMWG